MRILVSISGQLYVSGEEASLDSTAYIMENLVPINEEYVDGRYRYVGIKEVPDYRKITFSILDKEIISEEECEKLKNPPPDTSIQSEEEACDPADLPENVA